MSDIPNTTDPRAQTVADIRALANWLEAHPDAPAFRFAGRLHFPNRDEFIAAARILEGEIHLGHEFVEVIRSFGTVTLSAQTRVSTLLEEPPPPDRTDRVRALLAQDEAVA